MSEFLGVLDILSSGAGFLRNRQDNFLPGKKDIFVDRNLIDKMKPSAILINTARGALINERDLANALNNGSLAGACLDVLSDEPIRDDNPLKTAKNCLLTPHNAWATIEARRRLMDQTADNIEAFIGGRPINLVN